MKNKLSSKIAVSALALSLLAGGVVSLTGCDKKNEQTQDAFDAAQLYDIHNKAAQINLKEGKTVIKVEFEEKDYISDLSIDFGVALNGENCADYGENYGITSVSIYNSNKELLKTTTKKDSERFLIEDVEALLNYVGVAYIEIESTAAQTLYVTVADF